MLSESRKQEVVVGSETQDMWFSVLEFLCMELFGPEITEEISKFVPKGHPLQEGEKIIDVKLSDWEKRLFAITEAVYDCKNRCGDEWKGYQLSSFHRIADAFREIFWSQMSINHKEVRSKGFGIRGMNGSLVVVEVPQDKERKNPMEGIFGGMIPLPPFPPKR